MEKEDGRENFWEEDISVCNTENIVQIYDEIQCKYVLRNCEEARKDMGWLFGKPT